MVKEREGETAHRGVVKQMGERERMEEERYKGEKEKYRDGSNRDTHSHKR